VSYRIVIPKPAQKQLDNITKIERGGDSTSKNLCYACLFCNLQKGTDLGSINWRNGELVRFFNPRRDSWREQSKEKGA